MRLSRRLTGVLLVFALAVALTPTALAGKRAPSAPPAAAPTVAPGTAVVSMVDIEALR
jgi:hypothetical protein